MGVWQKGTEHREGLPEGTDSGGRGYPPGDFKNQLFGKGLMLKFYTPVSTSVLSEILLVKHLEQRLACK